MVLSENYPREIKTYAYAKGSPVFTEVLLIIAKKEKTI